MIFKKKLRYILVESSGALNFSGLEAAESLRKAMLGFMGQLHYFRANPKVVSHLGGSAFILSTNRGYEKSAILALSFIRNIGGEKVGLYTIRTSGTVRSLKSYFLENYAGWATGKGGS